MCGIAGIINKNFKDFDYTTFCTLGIANDSRGGDSCGIFIDGKYDYGIKEDSYFQSFFLNNKLLESIKKSKIALVHCRKASVGVITKDTAQPVVITDENGKVLFVVMHNGTIHNYKELAQKYIPNINIIGMTDSQVMAHIFFYKGYDVLSEYIGGAVFAIIDYRNKEPLTLLFKGKSAESDYSNKITEERPLYYTINNGELVFSSISAYLLALRPKNNVYILPSNVLLKFEKNQLIAIKNISRDLVYQKEIYNKILNNFYKNDFYNVNFITVDHENNIYLFDNKPLHGKNYISSYGRISSKPSTIVTDYALYFYKGVLLKNRACFNFISVLAKKSGLSEKEFFHKYENVIRFLSADPQYKIGDVFYIATTPMDKQKFTGTINLITTTTQTVCENGEKVRTVWSGNRNRVEEISKSNNVFNFKEIEKLCREL